MCSPTKLWLTRTLDCGVLAILAGIGALAPCSLVHRIFWISDSFAAVTSNVPIWLVSRNTEPWLSAGGGKHQDRQCASRHPSCILLWKRSLDNATKVFAVGWLCLLCLSWWSAVMDCGHWVSWIFVHTHTIGNDWLPTASISRLIVHYLVSASIKLLDEKLTEKLTGWHHIRWHFLFWVEVVQCRVVFELGLQSAFFFTSAPRSFVMAARLGTIK